MKAKVPVLFIIFNRPELTVKTFESIRTYQPDVLYIAADGPRENKKEDAALCHQTRACVLAAIDWNCQIHQLFREENVGCGRGVSEAISWLFQREEYGIIVEDDCFPTLDFFRFCEELLPEYKNEEQVWQINGFNPVAQKKEGNGFSFSRYPKIWGWATWKRAWKHFDFHLKSWPHYKKNKEHYRIFPFYEAKIHEIIWERYYQELLKNNRPKAWDLQWSIAVFYSHGLCAVPDVNLVLNTGNGSDSTNCKNENYYSGLNYGQLCFPLRFPEKVELNRLQNRLDSRRYMKARWESFLFKVRGLLWKR